MDTPRLAKDIMPTRLVTLSAREHVFDGIGFLLKHDISGAPVTDSEDRYLGVFSEKCCMRVLTATARIVAGSEQSAGDRTRARDFMVRKLITLSPGMDVFEAIDLLLKSRISGAPVLDENDNFLGVFSEKTSMRVLIESAYGQLPTTRVEAFLNTDLGRVVAAENSLLDIAQKFLDTPYRRLVVLRNGKLLGQISRRDVLRAEHHLSAILRNCSHAQSAPGGIDQDDPLSATIRGRLSAGRVRGFMDAHAATITEETDLLRMARIFLDTPYRRLPVLRDGQLVGLVTRRDLLRATLRLMDVVPRRTQAPLYLSSIA